MKQTVTKNTKQAGLKPFIKTVLTTQDAVDYFLERQRIPITPEVVAKLEAEVQPFLDIIRFDDAR